MTQARKHEAASETIDNGWVSLESSTRLLGISRERVLKLALQGALEIKHMQHLTFVSRASIDAYLAANATSEG